MRVDDAFEARGEERGRGGHAPTRSRSPEDAPRSLGLAVQKSGLLIFTLLHASVTPDRRALKITRVITRKYPAIQRNYLDVIGLLAGRKSNGSYGS